jgi:hypothetical protein
MGLGAGTRFACSGKVGEVKSAYLAMRKIPKKYFKLISCRFN